MMTFIKNYRLLQAALLSLAIGGFGTAAYNTANASAQENQPAEVAELAEADGTIIIAQGEGYPAPLGDGEDEEDQELPEVDEADEQDGDEDDADEQDGDEDDADEQDGDEDEADEQDGDEDDADEQNGDEDDADEQDGDEDDADEQDDDEDDDGLIGLDGETLNVVKRWLQSWWVR